jgi:flagellar basal body rod protein FlgG
MSPLPAPQRLRLREGLPWHEGPLVSEQGPERIESGWWDGAEVQRDYYTVRRADAEQGAVDLDREAADLLRFQQAYEAAARTIQIARETMQTMLNIF